MDNPFLATSIPKVGVGVLIFNTKNELLLGKRINTHGATTWGPPGGHLEYGESLEDCATRETLEETGLLIKTPTFWAITNDIFKKEMKHYISIFMKIDLDEDLSPKVMEPDKVEAWNWFSLNNLPKNLFHPIQNLFDGKSYGNQIKLIRN